MRLRLLLRVFCRTLHVQVWLHIIPLRLLQLPLGLLLLHPTTEPILPLHQAAGAAGRLAVPQAPRVKGERQLHNNMPRPTAAAIAAAVHTAAHVQ
jgi:hypothetical protein